MRSRQRSHGRSDSACFHIDLAGLISRRRRVRRWIGRAVAMAGVLAFVLACLACLDIARSARQPNEPTDITQRSS